MWYRTRVVDYARGHARSHARSRAAIPIVLAGLLLASCNGGNELSPEIDPGVFAPPPASPPDPSVADNPTPPRMTLFYPGAPCTLLDPGPASPGPCRGADDRERYLPFVLPANRSIEVGFDEPIDPATLVLGTTCDTGSVRVETLGPDGRCTGVVPGTLDVRERGLRFVPAAPWNAGQGYRVVLIAGRDSDCDPGEICGENGLPLNTNPLQGRGANEAGGPPATVVFTAAPPTDEALLLLSTVPAPGEARRGEGRVPVTITGTGGIVSGASIEQEDCLPGTPQVEACVYAIADLPVSIGSLQTRCTIGEDERGAPIVADLCIPVRIYPAILYGTSLTLDANVVGLGIIDNLNTGPLVMRLREGPNQPITGYIIGSPEGTLRFVAALDLYLDAPDLRILGGLASHDLRSKRLSLALAGPVAFFDDGRVVIEVTNIRATDFEVGVSALLGGSIRMRIPAGTVALRLVRAPE